MTDPTPPAPPYTDTDEELAMANAYIVDLTTKLAAAEVESERNASNYRYWKARCESHSAKLAAAQAHTQEVIADCDEYQRIVADLRKQLAAAEAVIEAAHKVAYFGNGVGTPISYGDQLRHAIRAHTEACRLSVLWPDLGGDSMITPQANPT